MNRLQSQEVKDILQAIDLRIVANEIFRNPDVALALREIIQTCQQTIERMRT